ncbi:hypothetical protein OAG77_00915 [bacterium]|nr:hypothetical protein [bacterium]
MDFLKKHYEKVILSIVLVLLAVAAAYLPIRVAAVNKDIETEVPRVSPKEFVPNDISTNIATLNRAQRKSSLKLSNSEHNLFNPVGWVKSKDGNLAKDPYYGRKGPAALLVSEIDPLFFEVTYERMVQDRGEIKYYFGATKRIYSRRLKSESSRLPRRSRSYQRETNRLFRCKQKKRYRCNYLKKSSHHDAA